MKNVSEESLSEAISHAKTAESMVHEYKAETYLAVLLAELLYSSPSIRLGADKNMLPATAVKAKTIGELFIEKRPPTDVDRVLTAGSFLEHVEGLPMFNSDDLVRCFERAKLTPPRNINDVVNKNIRKGLMMEASDRKDGKKAWLLTGRGDSAVESGFGS